MSCSNCGHGLAGTPTEHTIYAGDGSIHTLPRAFCPACGWPLARADISLWPPVLELAGDRHAELQAVVSNNGNGALYYSIDPDPRLSPASRPTLHGTVDAGARREIAFRLSPNQIAGPADELRLTVHTLTAEAEVLGQRRTVAVEELWVAQTLAVPVVAHQVGPLGTDAEHMLFGLGIGELYLNVLNFGAVPLEAELSCTQGYLVCGEPGAGFAPQARTTLRAGVAHDPSRPRHGVTVLRVRAPDTAQLPPGQLTIRATGQPPLSIRLEKVVPSEAPQPPYRFSVGIDFGTSKTAVAWVDHFSLPPEPRLITWPRAAQEDSRWLPSAVFYGKAYGQPIFGDAALSQSGGAVTDVGVRIDGRGRYEGEHGTLFVGMKMFLREADSGTPDLHQVATDFFRHVFEAIDADGNVRLRETQFVLTLPVLANPVSYQQQEELTVAAAAEAGLPFGIQREQFVCEKEPVCAAIDLMRLERGERSNDTALQNGDWLCVFDSGAGTTDISLMEAVQQGGEWRFAQVEPLGYEWGGDELDEQLYQWLMGFWCNPADPANIPASGPVAIKPLQAAPRQVIDADAPARPQPTEIDWFALMRAEHRFLFNGASQPVSRSELLGLASRFKEKYLNTVEAEPAGKLTSETPLLPLGPSKRGERGPWSPLRLEDAVNAVSLEFLNMRDGTREPLLASFPKLCAQLRIQRPKLVCPVGGTTLVRGWREAVEREPLNLRNVVDGDPNLRRLHVARGAAQRTLFRVEDRLTAPARLQILKFQPGQPAEVVSEGSLSEGSPPGQRQEVQLYGNLALQPGSRLLFRVLLGDRCLKQVPASWFEGLEVVEARGLGVQPTIRLEVTLRYLRGPVRLELSLAWLVQGTPTVGEPIQVVLPPFEVR